MFDKAPEDVVSRIFWTSLRGFCFSNPHRCLPWLERGVGGAQQIFGRTVGPESTSIQTTCCSNSKKTEYLVSQRSQTLLSGDVWWGRSQPPQILPPSRYVGFFWGGVWSRVYVSVLYLRAFRFGENSAFSLQRLRCYTQSLIQTDLQA